MKKRVILVGIIALMAFVACQNGVQEVNAGEDAPKTVNAPMAAPRNVTLTVSKSNPEQGILKFDGVKNAVGYTVYYRFADADTAFNTESYSMVGVFSDIGPDKTNYNLVTLQAVASDGVKQIQYGVQTKAAHGKAASDIMWVSKVSNSQ